MKFSRENAKTIDQPSAKQVVHGLRQLKSAGRSTFANLESADGSFVQVAGGPGGCVLEWKDGRTGVPRRAYLEAPWAPFEDGTTLECRAGSIALRRDEWMRLETVLDSFVAFLEGREFPVALPWRELKWLRSPTSP